MLIEMNCGNLKDFMNRHMIELMPYDSRDQL